MPVVDFINHRLGTLVSTLRMDTTLEMTLAGKTDSVTGPHEPYLTFIGEDLDSLCSDSSVWLRSKTPWIPT